MYCRNRTRSLIVCKASASAGWLAARLANVLLLRSAWARLKRWLFCTISRRRFGDEVSSLVISHEPEIVLKSQALHSSATRCA